MTEIMRFDWEKAAQITVELNAVSARAGNSGCWREEGHAILEDGMPVFHGVDLKLDSAWDPPVLIVGDEVFECYQVVKRTENPHFGTGSWPASALAIRGLRPDYSRPVVPQYYNPAESETWKRADTLLFDWDRAAHLITLLGAEEAWVSGSGLVHGDDYDFAIFRNGRPIWYPFSYPPVGWSWTDGPVLIIGSDYYECYRTGCAVPETRNWTDTSLAALGLTAAYWDTVAEKYTDPALKVFDWYKAAQLTRYLGATRATAALQGDWERPEAVVEILRDGKPAFWTALEFDLLASRSSTPELNIDGRIFACYRLQRNTLGWHGKTCWPIRALEIFESQTPSFPGDVIDDWLSAAQTQR